MRIVSGMQTGADQGALVAAELLGAPTGGWVPKGSVTHDGPRPDLRDRWGMVEAGSPRYQLRTFLNVRDSDGTAWFGNDSPGKACTHGHALRLGRPWIENPTIDELAAFCKAHGVETLNVAGNRERRNPGIGLTVFHVVTGLLRGL